MQYRTLDAALEAGINVIDTIVALGVDLAAHERLDTPPALLDPALRRR